MRTLRGLIAAVLLLPALALAAGEYEVSPLRLAFDADSKSDVVTLKNVGSDRLSFQIKLTEWTQDAAGNDRYAETNDLVFFPKILTVEPGEARVVRVGVRTLPTATERAFRLYIERLPDRATGASTPGMRISVNIRFALPIFVAPPVHQPRGHVDSASVNRGELLLVLGNSGNAHYRIDEGIVVKGLDANGNQVFTHTFDDRYVLAGISKRYVKGIPAAACSALASLEITAKAAQFTLSRKLKVDAAMCD